MEDGTERICEVCDLPFTHASMGGDHICPHCDCGIYRDGTRWTYGETVRREIRKAKAKRIYEEMQSGNGTD